MAVTRGMFGSYRQRNPLVDELLRQAQLDAMGSASIGAQQLGAESAYTGQFPIMGMTAKILKGITSQSKVKQAENLTKRDNTLTEILKKSELQGGVLPGDKVFDKEGNVMESGMAPVEGETVRGMPAMKPTFEESSVTVGKEPTLAGKILRGEIDETEITNKADTMAELGIAQDDLDTYVKSKAPVRALQTLYKGQTPFSAYIVTDQDTGSTIGVTDLDGKPITDLTGVTTAKAPLSAYTTLFANSMQKMVETLTKDGIEFTIGDGGPKDIVPRITQSLANIPGIVVPQTIQQQSQVVNDAKNSIDGIDNINIIDGTDDNLDIVDSLSTSTKSSTEKSDKTFEPLLSEAEKVETEKKQLEVEEKKVEKIREVSADKRNVTFFTNTKNRMINNLKEVKSLYKQLEALKFSDPRLLATALETPGTVPYNLNEAIKQFSAEAFNVNFQGMKDRSANGSAAMGGLSNAEGDRIVALSGQLNPLQKEITLKTIQDMIDVATEAEKATKELYSKLYPDEEEF